MGKCTKAIGEGKVDEKQKRLGEIVDCSQHHFYDHWEMLDHTRMVHLKNKSMSIIYCTQHIKKLETKKIFKALSKEEKDDLFVS